MKRQSCLAPKRIVRIGIFILILTVLFFLTCGIVLRIFYPCRYMDEIRYWCDAFDVPVPLVLAVIRTESRFNPSAVSVSGACGLMQLMPQTFEDSTVKIGFTSNADIFNTFENIACGVYYLSELYGLYRNWETALAAYNAGPGRVNEWLKDSEKSPDGVRLIRIPFPETRNYVTNVINTEKIYINLYSKYM